MKKFICLLLVLICAMSLIGCGSDNSVVVNPNASSSSGNSSASSGASGQPEGNLYYESKGVKVHVYDLADSVLKSLGNPKSTFEAASCAYQGMDTFYTYDGFHLTVNDVDGAKHVTIITVDDDTVSIPQGVKIGAKQEDMLKAMGNPTKESAGLYEFISGYTTLQIQIKEGVVASIMYVYAPEKK